MRICSKRSLFILTLCLFFNLLLAGCSPGIEAYDSEGRAIKLSDYKGKWVIINYWATWCKPCLKEMPMLEEIYQNNQDKLMVLGVSYEAMADRDIRTVAKNYGVTYPMLGSFPMEKFGYNHLTVLPTSFIINPAGKLIQRIQGPLHRAQILKLINSTTEQASS